MNPKFQIFISSTFQDLEEYRDAIIKSILEIGHIPVGMEAFGAANEDSWELIERTIKECDYYIVIVARRYGSISEVSGTSWTEREFDYAISQGIPCLAFLLGDDAPWEGTKTESDPEKVRLLNAFRKKIGTKRNVAFWKNKDHLAGQVSTALHKAFARHPRLGWARRAVDGEKTADEIARLSEENARLRAQASRDVDWTPVIDLLSVNEINLYENDSENAFLGSIPMAKFVDRLIPLLVNWNTEDEIEGLLRDAIDDLQLEDEFDFLDADEEYWIEESSINLFCALLVILEILEHSETERPEASGPWPVDIYRLSSNGKKFAANALLAEL